MKPLANFVMRGYSQATLVTTTAALLSVLMPLIGLLSSAALGLVTLRNGPRDGLRVAVLSTGATAVISWIALGSPLVAVAMLAVLWIPIWGLSSILRSTRALGRTVQLAGLGGLVVILVIHLILGDASAYWQKAFEPLLASLVKDGLVQQDAASALFQQLSKWMTGAFAAALVLQYLASLFIARAWQAQLYNPGGFGQEFRSLRLSPVVGGAFVLLLGWVILAKGGALSQDLIPLLGLLLMLQGLAIAHCLRHLLEAPRGWLVGMYLLLVLFMPQVGLLLASIGLVDLWSDLRGRIARRVSKQR